MEFKDQTQKIHSKEDTKGVDHIENDNSPPIDRFNQLMFGSRASSRIEERSHIKKDDNPNEEIDYFTLLEQIDDIMESLKNLKPILNHLSPIVDFIKKKI
ncbi:hypothetical protein [Metabacillus sediminilitoris]|uniref:Uncharacterized protein n=1 Tax=Metabacillus sediminilitoris TaxID=2567941 RepID=A0A4S4BV48_9BACI|nr:hypothetical protein [Metabacillus sediminilitoris]QGQ44654.1 hypothetical protein GMB29_04855 [Metabacillus sediminilitoris]THF78996.1 hypothetical protein E6W99_14870 [Metabacillus sediminilitoris]